MANFQMRCTDAQLASWKAKAAQAGKTLSALARELLGNASIQAASSATPKGAEVKCTLGEHPPANAEPLQEAPTICSICRRFGRSPNCPYCAALLTGC